MYTDSVKDHFANPRNIGILKNANAVGLAKNEADGDQVQIHLRIENNQITDVKVKVMGCVAAIAASSMFTELIHNKTIQEAKQVEKQQLSDALGGLPESKMRCSLTIIDAFQQALASFGDKS